MRTCLWLVFDFALVKLLHFVFTNLLELSMVGSIIRCPVKQYFSEKSHIILLQCLLLLKWPKKYLKNVTTRSGKQVLNKPGCAAFDYTNTI